MNTLSLLADDVLPEPVAADAGSDMERLEFRLLICEISGSLKSALPDVGFIETPSGMMRLKVKSVVSRDQNSQSQSRTLVRSLADLTQIKVLSAPTVVTQGNSRAEIQIGQLIPSIEYLVHEGDNHYERKTESTGRVVGQTIEMTPTTVDLEQQHCVIQLKIKSTEMDGRIQVAGLNLDVGEPIFTSKTLETTVHHAIGQEMDALTLMLSPDRYLLILLESLEFQEDDVLRNVNSLSKSM